MEKLLLLLLLLVNPKILQVNLLPDNYWQNETQSVQEDDNATTNSNGYTIVSEINEDNSILIPVDPLMKVAFFALMLHILIVGGAPAAIIIYSVIYCKTCSIKRRLRNERSEIKCRLQSPPTLQHLPNTQNCSCHVCRVTRQIVSGLIVQQIITEH